MVLREMFESHLEELKSKLMELGLLCEKALKDALKALEEQDVERALEIMDEDRIANVLEEEINDLAILLIAKQQPVATDLRRIIAAIKIASDLERIGDFAVNIAKSTIRIGQQQTLPCLDKIKTMHTYTSEMIELVLQAYTEEDVVKAKKIADLDDQIDDLYGEIIRELLSLNVNDPSKTPQIMQLSFICRYLERAADHVTNIAEHTFYLVKGRRYDLND
ncbi:phosphate signaling complex protein PhoU [Bacillus spongiae]|uniref:Phosphate-specific transport system accessory protein PhoU n=1 Tax=Bacillus spongiae TaxID=2683610 RepID=A0ABU8H957_9BACI